MHCLNNMLHAHKYVMQKYILQYILPSFQEVGHVTYLASVHISFDSRVPITYINSLFGIIESSIFSKFSSHLSYVSLFYFFYCGSLFYLICIKNDLKNFIYGYSHGFATIKKSGNCHHLLKFQICTYPCCFIVFRIALHII